MGVVVGFSWPFWHDGAACAIVDGRLVFATEEERYSRHKHAIGELPKLSLMHLFKYLKSNFEIRPKDIDIFAINNDPKLMSAPDRSELGSRGAKALVSSGANLSPFIKKSSSMDPIYAAKILVRHAVNKIGEDIDINKIRIVPVMHHLSHAASAYYFSGHNSATIVTLDGRGETDATAVFHVKRGEFKKVLGMPPETASIGRLYVLAARKMGYKPHVGEGKVMGLAPYGKQDNLIQNNINKVIKIDKTGKEPYTFNLNKILPDGVPADLFSSDKEISRGIFGEDLKWNPNYKLNKRAADLAYTVQKLTEQLVLSTVGWAKINTGGNFLLLAGGVALNAKANMEVYYSNIFDKFSIFPAAGDDGSVLGAAAYVYEHELNQKMKNETLKDLYLGPEYGEDEVKKAVKRSKWNAEWIGNDVGIVADMVAKNKIVSWFHGRAELGPRALGNRSIIADPTKKRNWKVVNALKGREWWRPLAPSLLSEKKERYFIKPVEHKFMVMMLKMNSYGLTHVPAVCHIDGTARLQTVSRDDNRVWYDVINAFSKNSGEGMLINTSFNLAGEPLVETPNDAIKSFTLGGFDAIYLDGWLIEKR